MELPRSTGSGGLIVLASAGSTNDELSLIAAEAPEFTVVLTLDQRAGRGRLGRSWIAPPGRTLAASVLLRPLAPGQAPLPPDAMGWLPLLAGAAMTAAVSSVLPAPEARLKWPNDVLIDGRKVSGLLTELAPGGAVLVGSGVNLFLTADELPTPTATSLVLAGATADGDELIDLVLSRYLAGLRDLVRDLRDAGGNAMASGGHAAVTALCDTLGRSVRVELPGGDALLGTAVGIDPTGRLQVRPENGGALVAVAAGDVVHLRPWLAERG
ncbi:biotin--[acetyl-CoA-carboxylase] ligase [Lysobacter korlensis]|uniref:biotin--[biotin carboxyl-carrier protein] ligase n=1 Tax=Lysobacter korlensis TaxID=553636 RepID=A0ABV6RYI7_9GAMM